MNDYERIARVIRYLDAHHTEQPQLTAIADSIGLSASHFHRLFTSWAGVTPKDFLQCVTLEHVKSRLRQRASVLDAALDAGLSGPGRLHDLCVSLEAASPGEMKSGGAGLTIDYGFSETPFGRALLAETNRGICQLTFVEGSNGKPETDELRAAWPHARLNRDDAKAADLAARIFNHEPQRSHRREEVESSSRNPASPLRAYVKGTTFQLRVWRALLRIPTGQLVSYGNLARAIGQPSASRAVGGAVGSNPVSFLIPCHRVIQETGALGGYRWGATRKRAMIAWESAGAIAD